MFRAATLSKRSFIEEAVKCLLVTMGLSRTVSEINGDFSRKLQNFPTPCILRRVALWIGYRRKESKN